MLKGVMGSRGSERGVREDEIARERERKNKGVQGGNGWGREVGERELQLWVQVYLEWLTSAFW